MPDEAALGDTNVLVYALFSESPHHAAARALVTRATNADANLSLLPQSLAEFYSIRRIYTFNVDDFRRFTQIVVLTPRS